MESDAPVKREADEGLDTPPAKRLRTKEDGANTDSPAAAGAADPMDMLAAAAKDVNTATTTEENEDGTPTDASNALNGNPIEQLQQYLNQMNQIKGMAAESTISAPTEPASGSAAAARMPSTSSADQPASQLLASLAALLPPARPGQPGSTAAGAGESFSALLNSTGASSAEPSSLGSSLAIAPGGDGPPIDLSSLLASAIAGASAGGSSSQAAEAQAGIQQLLAMAGANMDAAAAGAAGVADGSDGQPVAGVLTAGGAEGATNPLAGAALVAALTGLLNTGSNTQAGVAPPSTGPAGTEPSSPGSDSDGDGDGEGDGAGGTSGAAAASGTPNPAMLSLELLQLLMAGAAAKPGEAGAGALGANLLLPGAGQQGSQSGTGSDRDLVVLPLQPELQEPEEPMPLVTFPDGVKLNDGRIYVPLPFIHRNFSRSEFPLHTQAELFVNGELLKEACPIKIARSQNKTRRHGLGNHWITGHQRYIKHLKDARLLSIELLPEQKLKISLSSAGSWADTPVPQLPSLPSPPAASLRANPLAALALLGMPPSINPSPGGAPELTTLLLHNLLASKVQGQQSAQPSPLGAPALPGASPTLGLLGAPFGTPLGAPTAGVTPGGTASANSANLNSLLSVLTGLAGTPAGLGAGVGGVDGQQLGLPTSVGASHEVTEGGEDDMTEDGDAAMADAAEAALHTGTDSAGHAAAAAVAAAAAAGNVPQPESGAAAAAAAALQSVVAAAGAPAGAGEAADATASQDAAQHAADVAASAVSAAAAAAAADGTGASPDAAAAGASTQGPGASSDALAAALAALTAQAPGLPAPTGDTGGLGTPSDTGVDLGGASSSNPNGTSAGVGNLLTPELLGLLGLAPAIPSLPLALASLPPEQASALLSTLPLLHALQPQQPPNLVQMAGLLQLMGGGATGLGLPGAGMTQARDGQSNFPRLYDGRIHVPLNIITTHFSNTAEFPVQITARVYVNSMCIGENLQARIVRYKKHKRPNHFNYWITGLQKSLAQYNDVRQAGVHFESENVLRINLLAANASG